MKTQVHTDELAVEGGSDGAVKSAFRVLRILDLLAEAEGPLSFSECQGRLGYPKASLHGLLRTMVASRWVQFDEATKGYGLGVRVWEAGLRYDGRRPLTSRAEPFMTRLRDQTTETVQLAVLDDFDVLYIGKVEGGHLLRLESAVGRRMEPHASGVGKVLLAELPEDALRGWMAARPLERFTDTTVVDPDALLAELRTIRAAGCAYDREERTLGVACVAVGVRDHRDVVVAAMSVSAPAVRFGAAEQKAALRHLRQAADALSSALGRDAVTGPGAAAAPRAGRAASPGARMIQDGRMP